jgi:hypothetical protein
MRITSTAHQDFAKRLADAMNLKAIKYSPTELQKRFNSCFNGKKITPHSARNWMLGNTLPTQDKLVCLAQMLGMSSEFLRFGTNNNKTFVICHEDGTSDELTDQQKQFIKRYLQLNSVQQQLVSDLVQALTIKTSSVC